MSAPRHVLTILAVSDLARAVRLYREGLGWDVAVETPVYVELLLPGGQRFGLYRRENYAQNFGSAVAQHPAGQVGPAEIYLESHDPAALCRKLVELGARLLSPVSPRPWGDEVGYLADPDGHVLALARPLRTEAE